MKTTGQEEQASGQPYVLTLCVHRSAFRAGFTKLKRTSTALYKGDKAQAHVIINLDPVVETTVSMKQECQVLFLCLFEIPVRDVSPIHPAASTTPSTAAVSSNRTTLVLGSRLCITVIHKQTRIIKLIISKRSQNYNYNQITYKANKRVNQRYIPYS